MDNLAAIKAADVFCSSVVTVLIRYEILPLSTFFIFYHKKQKAVETALFSDGQSCLLNV